VGEESLPIECERHGPSYATFLCHHLLRGEGLGFVVSYDPEYPDDPRPEAWCAECDQVLLEEGEWNDRSEGFADFKVLCANCYDEVRRRNLMLDSEQGKTWFLENALNLREGNPQTFHLPEKEVRENLSVGQRAKMIFLLPTEDEDGPYYQGERMWVKVVRVNQLGYSGALESNPITEGSIRTGDEVLFGPEHVIDAYLDTQSDELWTDHTLLTRTIENKPISDHD
jgi:hypothetical protein